MRDWTAQDVRLRMEAYLVAEGRPTDVELLGTLVPDDGHLTVLVRSLHVRTYGQVQSVAFDLDELYAEAAATTVDRALDEVLHGAVHFLDMREVGLDVSGIRHWA